MLHLHCLVWLRGAFHFSDIRERLQSDPEYAACMVRFIDKIIRCSIDSEQNSEAPKNEGPSASSKETDREFDIKLHNDSNVVAAKIQMHLSSHNTTCFKYGAAATGKCRFDFPRP